MCKPKNVQVSTCSILPNPRKLVESLPLASAGVGPVCRNSMQVLSFNSFKVFHVCAVLCVCATRSINPKCCHLPLLTIYSVMYLQYFGRAIGNNLLKLIVRLRKKGKKSHFTPSFCAVMCLTCTQQFHSQKCVSVHVDMHQYTCKIIIQ